MKIRVLITHSYHIKIEELTSIRAVLKEIGRTGLRGTNLLKDIGKLLSGKAESGVWFLCP